MAKKIKKASKLSMPRKTALQPVGTSGLKNSGGEIQQDPLKNLCGEKGIKLFHEMSYNSSVIGAIRFLVRTWVTQADWYVKPADETPQAKDAAEFLESCMYDMCHSWTDFVGEALTMIDYGWAWHELIYKMRRGESGKDQTYHSRYTDGKIGWHSMPLRGHLSWFKWAIEHDRLYGMIQNDTDNADGEVLIRLEKSVHFRTETTSGNPEGRSLYRNAVLDWYALKRTSEFELVGIERDLTGLPVCNVPFDVLTEGTDANTNILPYLETALAQLKRDERGYLIMPPEKDGEGNDTGYKFSLLASPGKHQIDTVKVKQQYRANILQSVLAQFLEYGVAQHGSFALASSATNSFAMALGALMDNLAETINKQAVERLMRMNEIPQDYWPEVCHGDIETPNLETVGKYVQILSGVGLDMTDEETAKHLRRIADLPDDVEHADHREP
jgi:hypothetical protein